jgi:hypothetical protein
MTLPPVFYIVLCSLPVEGFASGGDPVTTLDDAADLVAELDKYAGDIPARVLRIADSLNCDDVTADVFDVIARRMAQRMAAE